MGDGVADDTEAIRNWLNSLKKGDCGYVPAGTYRFTEPLTYKLVNHNVAIRGDGAQQTVFLYDGEDKNCDLITIGMDECELHGWTLADFNIESKTVMKSGAALHLINLKHTVRLNNVSVSRVDNANGRKLWNGVFFDDCSLTNYVGFEINVQNEGIQIAGAPDSDSSADILIDQGTINFGRVGIHVGGGFGGLYLRQVLIYGSTEVGYLQDNSIVDRGNREIIITEECVLDACHSYCALFDEPKSIQCTVSFNAYVTGAGWIDPATPGVGIYIKNSPQGRFYIGSQHIKHNKSHGIQIDDASTYVRIASTTYIVGNEGYGIYGAKRLTNVYSQAIMLANNLGDTNITLKD